MDYFEYSMNKASILVDLQMLFELVQSNNKTRAPQNQQMEETKDSAFS